MTQHNIRVWALMCSHFHWNPPHEWPQLMFLREWERNLINGTNDSMRIMRSFSENIPFVRSHSIQVSSVSFCRYKFPTIFHWHNIAPKLWRKQCQETCHFLENLLMFSPRFDWIEFDLLGYKTIPNVYIYIIGTEQSQFNGPFFEKNRYEWPLIQTIDA